ncbi:MAG: organomercurial lyase [Vicinamibacteraceae bacterium]
MAPARLTRGCCSASSRVRELGDARRVAERPRRAACKADMLHLSTSAAHWWDNVVFACSTCQPFHAAADVDAWCARHALPKGAVLTIPALWSFASDWYGRHLDQPWRKRSLDETRALFARHGLTSDFWRV